MHRLLNLAIHAFVLGVGLLLTSVAVLDMYHNYQITQFGTTSIAKVIEKHEDHSSKNRRYIITFTFTSAQSTEPVTKTESVYFDTYQALQSGSPLPVRYLPDRPTQTLIDGQAPLPLWLAMIGTAFTIFSIVDIRKKLRADDRWRDSKRHMRISQATIDRLERQQRR